MISRAKLWKATQILIGLLVIAFAARFLLRNSADFRAQHVAFEFRPGWIVLALLTVLGAFALLIEAWRRVVLSQGETLAPLVAARIWLLASLGKYLPGKVWALAGAAVLAEAAGVRRSVAVTAALVLQALALGAGILVVGVTAPGTLVQGGTGLLVGSILLGGGALAGMAVLCSPIALARVQRILPASWPPFQSLRPGVVVAGLLVNVVAWVAYGLSLVLLARGLMPSAVPPPGLAIAVFTVSYLVGLVALVAPAGVGPRESVFVLLLSGPIGPKAALGLAIASRILLTVAELGAALPFLLWRPSSSRESIPKVRS